MLHVVGSEDLAGADGMAVIGVGGRHVQPLLSSTHLSSQVPNGSHSSLPPSLKILLINARSVNNNIHLIMISYWMRLLTWHALLRPGWMWGTVLTCPCSLHQVSEYSIIQEERGGEVGLL